MPARPCRVRWSKKWVEVSCAVTTNHGWPGRALDVERMFEVPQDAAWPGDCGTMKGWGTVVRTVSELLVHVHVLSGTLSSVAV